eukprot:214458-Chlamydomonas_euryale.AAC.3
MACGRPRLAPVDTSMTCSAAYQRLAWLLAGMPQPPSQSYVTCVGPVVNAARGGQRRWASRSLTDQDVHTSEIRARCSVARTSYTGQHALTSAGETSQGRRKQGSRLRAAATAEGTPRAAIHSSRPRWMQR